MFSFDSYCLDDEVWKDVIGYEGIYQASNLGRIRSVDGKVTHSIRHGERVWKGRILKNKTKIPAKNGFKVTLWENKTPKDYLVARLVCSAFNGESNLTVNHKNGNRYDNNVSNLEWLSLAENIKHGFENDLYENCCNKLTLLNKKGELFSFKSYASASRFLSKNDHYLSCAMKRNSKILDANKNEYFVKHA